MGEHDDTVRRARRRTTLLAVIGAVVGGGVGWFTGTGQPPAVFALGVIGFAAALGGLTGAFSIMFTTVQLSSWVSAPLRGLPREVQRHVTRAVRSGVPLDHTDGPELQRRAFDHAHAMTAYQPLALAQFLLLYVGIAGPQIPRLGADTVGTPWSRLICSVLLVTAAVLTPLLLRRIRNARRYMSAASRAAEASTVLSTALPPHIE